MLRHPQEFGAISSQYLPYVSILPAFSALQTALRKLPAPRQLDAQRKLRHWYWASVFTNRYSGAVESTSARDYRDVRDWFEHDDAEPGLIAEFRADLQDTIMNKVLWQQFDGQFVNKETFGRRFGQLADLRNGIRHSRSVDEVSRKEGEAAILWFEQVNGR